MAAQESAEHEHHQDDHSHGSLGLYLSVFVGLCVLTLISYLIGNSPIKESARLVHMVGMILVSCAKASLVMLFFMHLKWEASWKYVLTIPASIMAIFLILMLIPDVGRRYKNYSQERLIHAADLRVNDKDHGAADHSDDHNDDHSGHDNHNNGHGHGDGS